MTLLFCRKPVEGERRMVQVGRSHPCLLLLFHCNILWPHRDMKEAGKRHGFLSTTIHHLCWMGNHCLKQFLNFFQASLPQLIFFFLQWAWLLLFEAGESPICISLYRYYLHQVFKYRPSFLIPFQLVVEQKPRDRVYHFHSGLCQVLSGGTV